MWCQMVKLSLSGPRWSRRVSSNCFRLIDSQYRMASTSRKSQGCWLLLESARNLVNFGHWSNSRWVPFPSWINQWLISAWNNWRSIWNQLQLMVESAAVDLWLIQAAFSLVHGWIKPNGGSHCIQSKKQDATALNKQLTFQTCKWCVKLDIASPQVFPSKSPTK